MALRFLSATNGYIPSATGQVIAYIRKPDEFALNQYVQYIETPKSVGVYAVLGRDEMVRVTADALYAWEDGDPRPRGDANKVPFQWVEFRTYRRDYPWTLGYKAIDQSKGSWEPKLVHMDSALSKAMTNRTNRVMSLVQTAGNWGSNTASANTLNGGAGPWAGASDQPDNPKYNAIFKSLVAAAQRIYLATNSKIGPDKLQVIVSPNLAIQMGTSAEMTNYCRESPYAKNVLEQGLDSQWELWTLPKRYKGFHFVVEGTTLVTEFNKIDSSDNLVEATTNRVYAKNDTTAVLLARPGSLDGEYGSQSWSTVQIYHYGGLLEVEAFDEPKDRRVDGHVTEDLTEKLASAVSGFLITGVA